LVPEIEPSSVHILQYVYGRRFALNVVFGWRALAQEMNIRRSEIDRMSSCFCPVDLA